jgi:type VI secretion system protein ImpG
VKGVACKFRTSYDVLIAPLRLASARFDAIVQAPEAITLPTGASSKLSMTLLVTSEQGCFPQSTDAPLRVFIDGEPSFCAALRDLLFMKQVRAYVEPANSGRWIALDSFPVSEVGFKDDDALIEFPSRSHPAYRLLTEYFAFPEKFNFFDIDISAWTRLLPQGCTKATLHLVLGGTRSDSSTARLLSSLSANNLLLGCTPVVNLFRQRGDPIRMTHAGAAYPVVADGRRAFAYEVHSIDSVSLVRQTPTGESVTNFRPFYSLRHGETPEKHGYYWAMRRDELIAARSPGYETEISIVDIDFNPAQVETDTLSIELTCNNRDLPAALNVGLPGGDLYQEGGSLANTISFLRKPSQPQHFARGHGAHWRLISQLALNNLSLTRGGLEAFKEMLMLYDISHSPISQRQIGAITGVDSQPATAWMEGNPFPGLIRGTEVRLTIDTEGFVGSGMHAFSSIVDHFLSLYAHVNSFTRLVVVSQRTGEELLRCSPRSGDMSLA